MATPNQYLLDKLSQANGLVTKFAADMKDFSDEVDKSQIEGVLDETKHRFLQLQLPLMKAVAGLEKLGVKLTVQTGCFTATDVVPVVIDFETGEVKGFTIIKRRDKNKEGQMVETYATIGGFHEYGLSYAENGAKEAFEETTQHILKPTMVLVGVYDSPTRDARQHVASIAYVGATYDMPRVTQEAHEVLVLKPSEIPDGPWFASDHSRIVMDAIETFEANESFIKGVLAGLKFISTD